MLKVQEIRELIKLIDDSSISEFTYEADGATVSMKKQGEQVVQTAPKPTEQPVTPQPVEQEQSVPEKVTTEPSAKEEEENQSNASMSTDYDTEITSPMVGTFYEAPTPEDPAYIQVGDQVKSQSVVCIVEAMKLFNEIEAEVDGEIVEILVQNGELVEYGQPLFRVKNK
ncbi:acetyl-CoA carboxylase biotin carboxyl carrier protein [Halalkalibacillus halophilus]|uniref:acetyl-CoA carboxylase biotin carboxyl carrier protein n=1 Tax=Halalkalibacillus halophilus TaxID=392827 RepID=UPI000411B23E|nr:acetyl-CoA carboxylase biotin carboxyl carrier protein [Halalkalibacillus halophilus]